ncbi:hypothetical protein [Pseudomonas amygdali]|uniref:Uncharacterized protein n=2 Tax=Pseudomonas amygdali pv. lachrymans TaxID=53707 RepID=A0AAD0PW20_PSEAV|nr:hypothetical protein [Pseudomonas amygdali]AXH59818.1 hypothetical protein PLA107_031840 [Pseudomonas amygdali pv. lachrymans str. M301315]
MRTKDCQVTIMRLKSLFTSVPMGQFSKPRQAVLSYVLKEINNFLAPDTYLDEAENLVELHTKVPDALPRALKHVFEMGCLPADATTWRDVAGIDLYGCWLMDGGEAKDGWDLLRDSKLSSIDSVAGKVEEHGLHSILFQMNLRDSRLNLEGAAHIAEAVSKHLNYRRQEKGGLERASIGGFFKRPADPTLLEEDCLISYWNHFFCPPSRNPDQKLKWMVSDARTELGRRDPKFTTVLDYMLKVLVYNPGLRLLRETQSYGAVIEALDPVLAEIIENSLNQPWAKFTDDEYALFRRQVFLNLFSPFPEILAQLDVNPVELSGHPGKEFIEDKKKPSIWFRPNRNPVCQLKGPLQVFGYHEEVFAYFKHQELPFNLDWLMQGIVDDDIFRTLLVNEGRCDLLDYNLTRIADNLEVNEDVMNALKSYEFELDKIQLSQKATVGTVVMILDIANTTYQPKGVTASSIEDRLVDHVHFRDKLKADPVMKELLLARLKQSPEMLTHHNLAWCGFDGKILAELDVDTTSKLREDFFAGDLGL